MTGRARCPCRKRRRRAASDPVLVGLWIALVVVAVIWIAPFVFIDLHLAENQHGGDGDRRLRAAARDRLGELR